MKNQLIYYPLVVFLQFAVLAQESLADFQGIPGIYCGIQSCYDVLGVNRTSSREDIVKSYRRLAKKMHPDRFHNKEDKAEATDKFKQIATAYETLKDEESKKEYDDMLDDPEHYYRHYYRYYRRFYGAKVDARLVIVGVITVISIYQYFIMHSRYNEAINYFVTVPKYRFKAQELAKQKGLLPISEKRLSKESGGKKTKHKCKEEAKLLEESIIRQVIEENMDIRGGFAKPDVKNILWVQLVYLPATLFAYLKWYARWVYLFDIKGEPYGEDEQIYLISKFMGVSEEQLCDNEDVDAMLRQDLWIKENFNKWKKRRDEEIREKLADKPGFKKYRRYLRKGGPGQITFLDD